MVAADNKLIALNISIMNDILSTLLYIYIYIVCQQSIYSENPFSPKSVLSCKAKI